MSRRLRTLAAFLALAATGALSGCYAGSGGSSGYGGYTRGGGYSGTSSHSSSHYWGSGGAEEFLLYAGFYAGVTLVAGAFELIDRCASYCRR